MQKPWYHISNVAEVSSPALLIYPVRARENVRRMISMLKGDVSRLRPHVKTHKLAPLVSDQMAEGITKFKCATIAEGEMLGAAGAGEVLFAYQPVGPNVRRLIELIRKYPRTSFSAVVDDEGVASELSTALTAANLSLDLFVDVDVGMGRTGISPDGGAMSLYRRIATGPGLKAAGLHAYDGHINDPDPSARAARSKVSFDQVFALRDQLLAQGLSVPKIVAGGTPTFPMHALRSRDVECSPGTCVLWDFGYSSKFHDLPFLHAALVLTRVVSRRGHNRLCLDLGHKAIASENPHPRVQLLEVPDAKFITHSEEHLVVETSMADQFPIGSTLFGVPWHVCPTVALYSAALAVQDNRATDQWEITARARKLSI
jgi:D-serine deaminase-like pyridoxal phosphate-dependent protein